MTWVVPLALGGVAILVMAVFTVLSARKRHRAIVAPATSAGPRILVHDINDDRCTGCDACVSVCPTNVLDLVSNKSRVLRFHDCIQCEACMFACPTEALVMFPKGGVPPALKVPEIDENYQTAVPGQYLIGEVAGKPLVKNAANLGRAVIEHMLLNGLRPGALGGGENVVDVAIVGSGPGGLSAALTCIQKGLSYVVLEKEQAIASTISRYPKGKLVMAEPYDTENMSLLPVFDSGKEQLIPIWREVIDRVGLTIKQGESVETVTRGGDGVFEVKTTVATYRAQRAVLSIGTRGKPRTLQVPGENLPKIYSLLEDPDDWRGKSVLIVGGGDSACEAALALADAGAKVIISYRGKGFNRAAPKNKQAIEGYAAQGKVKSKLGSQVINFDAESVTMSLADGTQKKYPNDATFVLIGADPPIAWLEKMGVKFVERPHQYQLGKTDDMVRRFVANAVECPEDAARAAAQVLGGSIGIEPPAAAAAELPPAASAAMTMAMPLGEPVSGPRKWLRSATSIFALSSQRNSTNPGVVMPSSASAGPRTGRSKKFDAPVPLSEFAKRGKTSVSLHSMHSHNGRRDALSAGERTRILRMLRDEGGRMADEDSRVFADPAPGNSYQFDLDDSQPSAVLPDVPAKPAVVVGIAQAQAARASNKQRANVQPMQPRVTAQQFAAVRPSGSPPPQAPLPSQAPPPPQMLGPQMLGSQMQAPQYMQTQPSQAPLHLEPQMQAPPHMLGATQGPPTPPPSAQTPTPPRAHHANVVAQQPRRSVPVPFNEEPTRQVDDQLLDALRKAGPPKAGPPKAPPGKAANGSRIPQNDLPGDEADRQRHALPKPSHIRASHDEPTRLANIAMHGFTASPVEARDGADPGGEPREATVRASDDRHRTGSGAGARPPAPPVMPGFEDHNDPDEATRLASIDSIAALERARSQHGPANDERTRAVNIRNDPSISDIDWDLD